MQLRTVAKALLVVFHYYIIQIVVLFIPLFYMIMHQLNINPSRQFLNPSPILTLSIFIHHLSNCHCDPGGFRIFTSVICSSICYLEIFFYWLSHCLFGLQPNPAFIGTFFHFPRYHLAIKKCKYVK